MSDEEIEISEDLQRRIDEAKERTKDFTLNTITISADGWYVAAHLFSISRQYKNTFELRTQALPNISIFTITLVGETESSIHITITGAQSKTYIVASVSPNPAAQSIAENLIGILELFGRIATTYHRKDATLKFEEIVELYYQRRREGENPNLRALADEYKVNYGSLRQYKMRYDAERKRAQE